MQEETVALGAKKASPDVFKPSSIILICSKE